MQTAIFSWKGVIIHDRWQLACLLEGKGRVLVLSSARSAVSCASTPCCLACPFLTSNQLHFSNACGQQAGQTHSF